MLNVTSDDAAPLVPTARLPLIAHRRSLGVLKPHSSTQATEQVESVIEALEGALEGSLLGAS